MRDRMQVMYEIDVAKRRIAANRKTAATTNNPTSAHIADATLPSLQRSLAELERELLTAPKRKRETFGIALPEGATLCRDIGYRRMIGTDEIAAFPPLPDFLKRPRAGARP